MAADERALAKTLCFSSLDGVHRFIRMDMMSWATARWLETEASMPFGDLLDEAFRIETDHPSPLCFEQRYRRRLWSLIHVKRGEVFRTWEWPLKEGLAYLKDHYHPCSPWQRVWADHSEPTD